MGELSFTGIYNIGEDLWQFLKSTKEYEKVIVFTYDEKKDAHGIFRVETIGVQNVLMKIGIPANILGFSYLVKALDLISYDTKYLKKLSKNLYVDIANDCSSTPSRVERNIRKAIEIGCSRGDMDFINEIFGWSIDYKKGVPTNAQFLCHVYNYIVNNR